MNLLFSFKYTKSPTENPEYPVAPVLPPSNAIP
jgi:hypothetical protein